ncbi:MAG TPA: hypothetical protein VGP90_09365, partial [Acidimicrobiia bacterium]|nr:hypothetical protein [Acidimicrobiia bacterium]
LAGVSDAAPALLVLDDLHWAAQPTLVLLRHFVRHEQRRRLLVVGTYRDTDLSRSHPLAQSLADLRREPGVERLTLAGLGEDEVAAFVEAAAGHTLHPEDLAFARAVHAETDGNPFFVGEVLRHLTETGAVVQRAGRWMTARPLAELGIPEGVREVIGRRLSRLPEAANEILAVAAVIGPQFEVGLLAEASQSDEDLVLDTLEQAEEARLIGTVPGHPDRYAFSHALVRSTLYEELATTRRLRLHRRIGRALEARPDADARVAELARHFAQAAGLGETDRAVTYARRAGDRARGDLAFEEAATHYDGALAALELLEAPDPATFGDLQLAMGDVLHRAGDPRHRAVLRAAAAHARTTGDARRLVEAVLALNPKGVPTTLGKTDQEIVDLAEEALPRLGPADGALRARLLALLAMELTFTPEHERRVALVEEAVAVARRVADQAALARVLVSCHWCARQPDTLDAVTGWAGELVALGEELGDPEVAFWGHLCRHDDRLEHGDMVGARADLAATEELARRLRQPLSAWRVAVRRTGDALIAGDLADVESLANAAQQLSRDAAVDESFVDGIFAAHLFLLRYEQRRLAEVEEMITGLADTQPGLVLWRAWLTLLKCEGRRLGGARSQLAALTADDLAPIPRDLFWLFA